MYTKIFSPKYRNYLKGITYSVFLAFLLSLSSCYTFNEETITPKDLRSVKTDYDILKVIIKKDSVINLEHADYDFDSSSNSSYGILRYEKSDTIYSKIQPREGVKYRVNISKGEINLDSVSKIKIETKEYNQFKGLLIGSGIVIGVLIIIALITKPLSGLCKIRSP